MLHGGGNTSVKTRANDVFGDEVDVLCVKGSGWDLASIEPAGHPAVRLAPLLRLRELNRLSDEDMVNAQRANLLDQAAPNPSVETLLHAFIPEKFIDHTHASAFLAIGDQPDAERLIGEVFGDRVACVPYVMPGFELARKAAEAYRAGQLGLALLKHGLFSFGASARESYERMIALVSLAEDAIPPRRLTPRPMRGPVEPAAKVLPILRGAFLGRWLDGRSQWDGDVARSVVDDDRHSPPDWATRGVATPDHVIRTKARPLVTATSLVGDLGRWRSSVVDGPLETYATGYAAYFERNRGRAVAKPTMLDPAPRVVAIPGLGLAGLGRSAAEAAIVGDIAESWAATLLDAEAVGRFEPVGEADTFDMEYWSLEQAKLGRRAVKRLEGRVAVITGAAGAIGAATAKAFAAEGCELALLDLDLDAATVLAGRLSPSALAIACDLTHPEEVDQAFERICRRFGGVDIVISNAGAAITGEMASLPDEALRRSFEINFFAHQTVAKAAAGLFEAQGLGGARCCSMLPKQALNPARDFGAYGLAKSALLAAR